MRCIHLVYNENKQTFRREFRVGILKRHWEKDHKMGKTAADKKKTSDKEHLKNALVASMSDALCGNHSMFQRNSFKTFFIAACEYSKNYRQIPDFLNFHPKAMARLVKSRSKIFMEYMRLAVNQALKNQNEEFNAGEESEWLIMVTVLMDHTNLKELKAKVGCVNLVIRVMKKDGSEEHVYQIPIHMWDVMTSSVPGTTARANAFHLKKAVTEFFDEKNMIFLGCTVDGAILDKQKTQFVEMTMRKGFRLMDLLSSSCVTHAVGLSATLSITRPLNDYDLDLEKKKKKRRDGFGENSIWCGLEKQRYRESFETFIKMSNLLGKKPKRRTISLEDIVKALAKKDYEAHKGLNNSQRTNCPYLRWKNHYFRPEIDEQPSEKPPTLIKLNDKKMRRFYEKCRKMLDNIPYLKIAVQRSEFKKEFKEGVVPEIDNNFVHMMGQWVAMVRYLWAISDSTAQGYNSNLMRNLMVVLTALLEDTHDNVPNENILLR